MRDKFSNTTRDFYESFISFSALHRIQELRAQGDTCSANSILKEWIIAKSKN